MLKNELQEKDTYLEEKVEVLKQLLEQENEEKEELERSKQELKTQLEANIASLQGQIAELNNTIADITAKFNAEQEGRKKENEEWSRRAKAETKGLEILKKNLEEHIEDLFRWQKYLDLDTQSEVDFTGEIRPQILLDISKENFDEQVQYLAKKLEKENTNILDMLKIKEADAKALKDKKKKDKQKRTEA